VNDEMKEYAELCKKCEGKYAIMKRPPISVINGGISFSLTISFVRVERVIPDFKLDDERNVGHAEYTIFNEDGTEKKTSGLYKKGQKVQVFDSLKEIKKYFHDNKNKLLEDT
jgi:hypothetical protein